MPKKKTAPKTKVKKASSKKAKVSSVKNNNIVNTALTISIATTAVVTMAILMWPQQKLETVVFEDLPAQVEPGAVEVQERKDIVYTVQEGDSLSKIAREQIGDETRYLEIINLNSDKYPGFNLYSILTPGMELDLPSN